MAYSEQLATRVRDIIADHPGYSERKMFGGICFMVNGNMACGVLGDDLMLRLDKDLVATYRLEPHTRDMDFTGRPMPSMMFVEAEGIKTKQQLSKWAERAVGFASELPPK